MPELNAWAPALFVPAVIIVLAVHEMGHLLAAVALGVKPLEFGIGIPPRLVTMYTGRLTMETTEAAERQLSQIGPGIAVWVSVRAKADGSLIATKADVRKARPGPQEPGHTIMTGRLRSVASGRATIAPMQWTLGSIPIGAFVRVAEGNRGPMALETASHRRQAAILGAGILANLILPIFALSAATVTASVNTGILVANPEPASAAWESGIRPGDRIIAVNGQRVRRLRDLSDLQTAAGSQEGRTSITVRRADGERTIAVGHAGRDRGLGLNAKNALTGEGTVEDLARMPVAAAHNTVHMYRVIGEEIGSWFHETGGPELVSPIGAARETGNVVEQGRVTGWLIVVALFSANVGLANMLPIMPLDGGRLTMVALRAATRGHPLNRGFEAAVSYAGMAAIVAVTITLVIKDITTMLGG